MYSCEKETSDCFVRVTIIPAMVVLGKSACGGLSDRWGRKKKKNVNPAPISSYSRQMFQSQEKKGKKTLATYLESLSLDASLFTPFSVPHVV